jgi:transposase
MVKALSVDLRKRVVAAVDGGLSRNQAAKRFGVSVASAVRWCSLQRLKGDIAPLPQGGDHRSARIEAKADVILAAIKEQPDITLSELQTLLKKKHKQSFGTTTLWRFFERHTITLKKSQPMRRSKIAPTS